MDVRERLDDVEKEVSKLSGGADGREKEEEMENLRRDVDFVMGKSGEGAAELSGIPTLVGTIYARAY